MHLNPPFDRITIEPGKMGGQPCIRGMRITVRRVLELLSTYPKRPELFENFPDLEEADLQQVLAFAAAAVHDGQLFTVVMDFEGTTSVAQFKATSAEDAHRLWLDNLTKPAIYGLTERQRTRLARGYEDVDADLGLRPAPLTGLRNVWCTSVSATGGGSALLNIIESKSEFFGD